VVATEIDDVILEVKDLDERSSACKSRDIMKEVDHV
jgi:hypothetical protein